MKKNKRAKSNNTSASRRRRDGSTLKTPFEALGGLVSWSSWKDEYLPNILWACVLTGSLEREHYLELFRAVGIQARKHLNGSKDATLCHNFLSTVEFEIFRDIFSPLLADPEALKVIGSLKLVESLPDCAHWQKLLPELEDPSDGWNIVSRGVAATMDHQSQAATDVRWIKLSFLAIIGKMRMPSEMADNLRLYPNHGDMRVVRPSIRATEMSTRMMEAGSEKPDFVPDIVNEGVWEEFRRKTSCVVLRPKAEVADEDLELQQSIENCIDRVSDHFFEQIKNTHIDARLDSSFGIVLYILSLAYELAHLPSRHLASGRIALRSIVEMFITLAYLRKKDDPTIWMQFRNYGYGQSALAFLKISVSEAVPEHIDMERLEMLANEDVWLETRDIDLGSWGKTNLRAMSDSAGVKSTYDQYYDWTSGFVHGHWGAIRDTVFTTCMNPLHRLHRVPRPMSSMPSVLSDCCKLANRALDELNALYPTLKARITSKPKSEK